MGELERIQLMHLCSNVFPTGIFTHSFGYEGMLEAGMAKDIYLTGTLLAYVQVAIKLIPLSQIDGQVVMKHIYPEILECVKEVIEIREEDIFSFTPMSDIASMNHETQESRMYMS